jgi:3-phenylpropionate/trans-cinnamate dioxygenase ferredoxin subunit
LSVQEGEVEVEFVTVARVGEIPDGEARAYEIGGISVAVCNCNGRFFAVSDICTHAHALLHEGNLDRARCTIECALHGAEYDLRTGEVLTPPATEPVATFAVRVSGDEIQVCVTPEPHGR